MSFSNPKQTGFSNLNSKGHRAVGEKGPGLEKLDSTSSSFMPCHYWSVPHNICHVHLQCSVPTTEYDL